MSLISASNLSKSFGVTPVLTGVSFRIDKGDRIGIVGANGAGKTTLMDLIAGRLEPDEGRLDRSRDLTMASLLQRDHFPGGATIREEMLSLFADRRQMEEELAALAERIARQATLGDCTQAELSRYDQLRREYEYESRIRGVLASLAFPESWLDKSVTTLSGGERTRLALASVLLQDPDLMLLDEPTNHLDIGTLQWLEQYLASYRGTLVVISHDRYFLDRLATAIFEVEHHKLTVYPGNYTAYTRQKKQAQKTERDLYEAAQAEIRRQEEIIRRFKGHNTEKLVKRARSRERMLARMELPDKPGPAAPKLKLHFAERIQSGEEVLTAENLSVSLGSGPTRRQLFSQVDALITRGERICIVGPNGIGKTTLLKIFLGLIPPDTGTVRLGQNVLPAYYDQEQQDLNDANTVLEEVHRHYRLYDQGELRGHLGRFLFRGDDVFKRVGDLAGGEKARLSLLKLMLSGSNLLILDEPTNHLDIPAKEVFEEALLDYEGTIVMVSHDRYLLQKVPTAIWELGEEGIQSYLGTYDDYREKSRQAASGRSYLSELGRRADPGDMEEALRREQDKEERMAVRQAEKDRLRQEKRKERDIKDKEADIASAEGAIASLEEELCKEAVYSDPLQAAAVSRELEEKKTQLERLLEEWVQLH